MHVDFILFDHHLSSSGAPSSWILSLVTQPSGVSGNSLAFWKNKMFPTHLVLSLPQSWNQPFLQGALVPSREEYSLGATAPGGETKGSGKFWGGRASDLSSPLALNKSLPLPLGWGIRRPVKSFPRLD